ncbi:endonuclease V [Mycotypha africana]|uniref:endonuclease V n=1 Tax=Mycotypha africana TaxID=64632 RepID=UPI002301B8F3|nr:endonuclease V [Mycotypha africana]KAI8991899.1 endonuclease V [Mycotypha africana]
MSMPDCKIVYKKFCHTKLQLPYISGFLAFREVQPLLVLLEQLKHDEPELYPQIILVDGNGLLHPRRFGIACHLGVLANTPTIGVAKNFLVIPSEIDDMSTYKRVFDNKLLERGDEYILKGASNSLIYGSAVRTSDTAKNPVFVSQGHRVSLKTAIKIVLATCIKYRLPEPIRAADQESREYIRRNPCFAKT